MEIQINNWLLSIKKTSGILILILFLIENAGAQQSNFKKEVDFALYLSEKQLNKEAVYVLQNIDSSNLTSIQKDSLNYFLGMFYFNQKKLIESAQTYLKVTDKSEWYYKSKFYAGYNYSFSNHSLRGISILDSINISNTDSTLKELQQYELACNELLNNNFRGYKLHQQKFSYTSYAMSEAEKKTDKYYETMLHFKKRSPVIAGLLSAVVPGLGKYYAGKKRQAVGTFLPILSLGILSAENYHKGGVRSAGFIGFASLFTLFYAGNIWGSIASVRIVKEEHNRYYYNEILFNMQLPIRNLFR